jgi:hypothetical protein
MYNKKTTFEEFGYLDHRTGIYIIIKGPITLEECQSILRKLFNTIN